MSIKINMNTKKNDNYKNLFDNYFNNYYYYDLCNYPINVLNYICSCSNCTK